MPSARMLAQAQGHKFYEGQPCKLGHTKRYVVGKRCVECRRTALAEWKAIHDPDRSKSRARSQQFRDRQAATRTFGARTIAGLARQAALAVEATHYEGRPCTLGHTRRYTVNGHCVECSRVASREWGRKAWADPVAREKLRKKQRENNGYTRIYQRWYYAQPGKRSKCKEKARAARYRARNADKIAHRKAVHQNTLAAIMGTLI